jgi:hypothetical protein
MVTKQKINTLYFLEYPVDVLEKEYDIGDLSLFVIR